MYLEANITIDVPNDVDAAPIIQQLQEIISSFNGNDTEVNVIEVDDPMSMNPVHFREAD